MRNVLAASAKTSGLRDDRKLDNALNLTITAVRCELDSRTGQNPQHDVDIHGAISAFRTKPARVTDGWNVLDRDQVWTETGPKPAPISSDPVIWEQSGTPQRSAVFSGNGLPVTPISNRA